MSLSDISCVLLLFLSDISCVLLLFLSDISSSVGHYLAFCCHFCRTNLALSDISCFLLQFSSDIYRGLALSDIYCVFLSFLSDISSCGHNWLCRTYLAGTGPTKCSRCFTVQVDVL